jgi:VWFA-related protein
MPLRDPSAAHKTLAPLTATDPVVRDGLFTIDVVVTDAAENLVSDLAPPDFTLLDNGQPAKIRTLHNSLAPSEAVAGSGPELIFVLDTVNLSPPQLAQTESALIRFLRRNNGHLEDRSFLYRLTRDGLYSSLAPTRDGNLLAKEVEQHKSPRIVTRAAGRSGFGSLGSWESGLDRHSHSVHALGSVAIDQREIAGRKIVIWIGPGWPVLRGGDNGFDEFTELSTRLREARISLDNVTVWPNPEVANSKFNYRDYVEPPLSQKEMRPERMALPAIATETGGLTIDSSDNQNQAAYEQFLDQDIERCVAAERSFYTLTFNPPHTSQMDEYHELRVRVARPALTVRAPAGYYNEPAYFDNPRPGIEKATVAQLEELVHGQTDLLRKLENLELTERLSTPRLDALLDMIHDERERQALTADADLSLALAPSADEIANRPAPSMGEQQDLLERAFGYLKDVIPKLPDFYALRNTVRFEEPQERTDESWKMPHGDQTLHFATGEHATVLYRNGSEVVEKKRKISKGRATGPRTRGLETWGTFGPILAYVLTAATKSPSTLRWQRWERGKDGDLAVFAYSIPSSITVHEISFCCLPEGDGTTLYQNKTDAYGEFALNPDTGAIMRIVINANLNEERDPDVPLIRSQVIVEYGPVDLGGKTYTCPQRSVTISRGRSERVLQEWGMAFSIYGYFETMINDATFGGYHKFGSEARILPGFEETR